MRAEQISDALNLLDEDLIEETQPLRNRARHTHINHWKALGMIAACISMFLLGTFFLKYFPERPANPINPTETENSGETRGSESADSTTETVPNTKLPLLTLSGFFGNLGSGFDEIVSDNITSYTAASPWRESSTPEMMPVFENIYYTEDYVPYGYSREEMETALKQIVLGLGAELISSEYTEATKYESAYLMAFTSIAEVKIDGAGIINISFFPLELPQECRIRTDTTNIEASESLNYLIDRFWPLFDYSEPVTEICLEYDYLGRSQHKYTAYEGAGNLTDDLLHRQYQVSEFIFTEHGDLKSIQIKNGLSCAEKMEDYPIITAIEAHQLLLDGNYFSQGSNSFTVSEERIAAVELVYPPSKLPEMIIPYYCFYVEDPEAELNECANSDLIGNLKIYRKCYVPAVEEQFIENMPVR